MLFICCRIIVYVLLCSYTPFRADYMKEVMQQTNRGDSELPRRIVMFSNEGMPRAISSYVGKRYLTFAPYITAKSFIRALLHPDPAPSPHRRPSAGTYMAHE